MTQNKVIDMYNAWLIAPAYTHSLMYTKYGKVLLVSGEIPLDQWIQTSSLGEFWYCFAHLTKEQAKKYKGKNRDIWLTTIKPKKISPYPDTANKK